MKNNFIITGAPGKGKTTVIKRVVRQLKEKGWKTGGIFCPEIRENGQRKGFQIIDIWSGESKILSHVDESSGPRVGKYRVNVTNVDHLSRLAFVTALQQADLIVIDEIAPMEVKSKEFCEQVMKAMEAQQPVLATVHQRSRSGIIGKIKEREDIQQFEVAKENRDELPQKLVRLISEVSIKK